MSNARFGIGDSAIGKNERFAILLPLTDRRDLRLHDVVG